MDAWVGFGFFLTSSVWLKGGSLALTTRGKGFAK